MNINLGNQGHSQGLGIVFNGDTSPYLSPLCGSLSVIDQNQPDQLLNFHLQEQGYQYINRDNEIQEAQQNPQIFLDNKVAYSEAGFQKQQIEFQKLQIKTPASIVKPYHSKVYSIIQFLVVNDSLQENELLKLGKCFYESSQNLQYVFKILLSKFKKLRKTKQQMVKYCMRKAFKFTTQLSKSPKSKSKKQRIEKSSEKQLNIQMPFRKNSSQKTMNSHFLKQVFRNSEFLAGYTEFISNLKNILEQFSNIIQQDNNSKISYLAETIEKILSQNQIKQIENIKRLPWTRNILNKTEQLARNLIQFSNVQSSSFVSKFEQQQN